MYVTMYDTYLNYIGLPGIIAYDTREIIHSAKYKSTKYLAYLMQPATPSSSLFVHLETNDIIKCIRCMKSAFSNDKSNEK